MTTTSKALLSLGIVASSSGAAAVDLIDSPGPGYRDQVQLVSPSDRGELLGGSPEAAIGAAFLQITQKDQYELSFVWPVNSRLQEIAREHRVQADLAEALKERDRLNARLSELDLLIETLSKH